MSLRARIFLASMLAVLVPLALLAYGIRSGMNSRFQDLYTDRVDGLATIVEDDLNARLGEIRQRLEALEQEILDDNDLRLAMVDQREDYKPYLIDYAGRAMRMAGLSMLQIQDSAGKILSSGHFRNAYDHYDAALPDLLASAGGKALVQTRRPEGDLLALAAVTSFQMGGRRFTLVGGVEFAGSVFTGPQAESDLAVSLIYPGGVLSSSPELARRLAGPSVPAEAAESDSRPDAAPRAGGTPDPDAVPQAGGALDANRSLPASLGTTSDAELLPASEFFVRAVSLDFIPEQGQGSPRLARATLLVSHPREPLDRLLRSLDRWLGLFLILTAAGSLLIAVWFSAQISRPLQRLAEKTTRIDLDRLQTDFSSDRKDEVGELSRFLGAMTRRLRASVSKLRDAERRATLGELARQVNHDIRNGFTPIRHVVRHLAEVARDRPEDLPRIFRERESTLESGLSYLEGLSTNYARLSPRLDRRAVDLNAIAREIADGVGSDPTVRLRVDLDPDVPPVTADAVGLRRVVENLVRNARESLEGKGGEVTMTTRKRAGSEGQEMVALTVADTGRGMTAEEQARIFEQFYTTKKDGIGLGLSIVRRLVSDFEGTVKLESAPGKGTRFTILLPAVRGRAGNGSFGKEGAR